MSVRITAMVMSVLLFAAEAPAQKAKTAGAPAGNPFGTKKHHASTASEKYRAFRSDIRALSEKLPRKTNVNATTTGIRLPDIYRPAEIVRLRRINEAPVDAVFDDRFQTPVFLRGKRLQSRTAKRGADARISRTSVSLSEREIQARAFLSESRALLRVQDASSEFRQVESTTDHLEMTHVRFQQMYKGFEVWGYEARVHLNRDGNVESYNGRTVPTMTDVERQQEAVDQSEAIHKVATAVSRLSARPTARRVIDVSADGSARKCWLVDVRGGLEESKDVFVDMETGEIRRTVDKVCFDGPVSGTGTDLLNQARSLQLYLVGATYYMIDASKAMFNPGASQIPQDGKGVIYTLDARNADSSLYFIVAANDSTWPDKASVSASYNSSKVYDFYNTVYGRNAIDGAGGTMNVVINFKTGFNNAFWNGQLMVFGNGDGSAFSDLSAALDVTAHEMTHGVVERTANLVYENQPGALNESFADVFGVLFEFWAEPGTANWLIGETITTPGTAGDALRRMDDPGAANIAFGGQQPAHMNQFQNLPNTSEGDHGGVHTNSGIPNKAFYNLATSSGVTKEEAGQIYFRALTNYLTRNSQFVDCRLAVIKAAEDLYGGPGNAKATAAAAAFDAVGVTSGSATPPPPTQPPVQGSDYLAVIDAGNGLLYRSSTAGSGFLQLGTMPLNSRPTVTDDGSTALYVDNTTNVHSVLTNGTNDQALTTGGGFNNVSISPNGRYLAATSTFSEAVIYVFDLQSSGNDKVLPLYTPTYSQGASAGNVLYPDRLDWMSNSEVLMYDCFNIVVNASGDTTGYWDINLIRPADTAIARLFPPQSPGVNIGNAVFASNSDNVIAFDYFEVGDSVFVLAVDLNTGSVGKVTNNIFSLGSPSFSNDDGSVYYHYIAQTQASTWVVGLASDGVTGLGNDQGLIDGAIYPVSFTTGTRTTGVDDESAAPLAFGMDQNFPNPFNPETRLSYRLASAGHVRLTVLDLLGREIASLVDKEQASGEHVVTWNAAGIPSGTYVCRLQSGGRESISKIMLVR